ncbi:unnamed protein product [Cylindrotheca closterium]|uniref:Uncharacterized protein n=1 Tax=Cylindrotheca closterium TaxID=2856 RepID=A0AAD2FDV1_9STRA|nr:unnamed protein product [Cylindrotheca closterium]
MSSSKASKKNESTGKSIVDDAKEFLTNEENKPFVQYGILAICGAIVIRSLIAVLSSFAILVIPLLYFYLVSCCPKPASFDGRSELKRVLRGKHLPENHPEKPKSSLEKLAAKVTASVTAEIATLPGYTTEMTPFFKPSPAAILTCMNVPTLNMQYYWVGANGKWYYVFAKEIKPNA